MPVKLNGSTSGYTQIQAAATAGNNTLTLPTSGTNLLADNGSGALTIQTINSGSSNALTLQSNNATAITIDTSQNVGIGTTSPGQKLSLGSGSSNVALQAAFNTATGAAVVGLQSDNSFVINQQLGQPLIFKTSNAEQMRIDSSGNVNIGTTSYSSTSPGTQFSPANGIAITSNAGFNIQCNKASAPSQTAWQVFNVNNTLQGYINYTNPGTQYITSSDVRLKTNIVDSSSALPILSRLQVRSFDWKENGSHEDYQWIAQEVYSVFPAAAAKGVDKEDGSIELPWGVDPAKMVGLCIKALQEAAAKIEAQAADIAALKAKVGV